MGNSCSSWDKNCSTSRCKLWSYSESYIVGNTSYEKKGLDFHSLVVCLRCLRYAHLEEYLFFQWSIQKFLNQAGKVDVGCLWCTINGLSSEQIIGLLNKHTTENLSPFIEADCLLFCVLSVFFMEPIWFFFFFSYRVLSGTECSPTDVDMVQLLLDVLQVVDSITSTKLQHQLEWQKQLKWEYSANAKLHSSWGKFRKHDIQDASSMLVRINKVGEGIPHPSS